MTIDDWEDDSDDDGGENDDDDDDGVGDNDGDDDNWPTDLYVAATCRSALGMQSEEIPDSSITASSSLHPVRLAPSCGRLID